MNKTPLSQTGCDVAACVPTPVGSVSESGESNSRERQLIDLLHSAQDDIQRLRNEILILRSQVYVVQVFAQMGKASPVLEEHVHTGSITLDRINNALWSDKMKTDALRHQLEMARRDVEINRAVELRVAAELRAKEFDGDSRGSEAPSAVKPAASRPARKRAPRKR